MATVPNWIGNAVILTPGPFSSNSVQKVTGWRATKTQVVVSVAERRRTRRFHLDTLTEVGGGKRHSVWAARLTEADDPAVLQATRAAAVKAAHEKLLSVIDKVGLQDSTTDPGVMVEKLTVVRDAVSTALASLADHL